MRDKANQFTLGTFTSTFVYCLLIMRVTRTGDPANVESEIATIIDLSRLSIKDALAIKSDDEGYLQTFNKEALLKLAKEHNLIIRIQFRPGDFCIEGNIIAHVWGCHAECSAIIEQKIKNTFALGVERTVHQNVLFLADELVEILARALSPGVNDPFTAINCMNWFHSALNSLSRLKPPSPYKVDDEGQLRLIIFPISFERFLSVICDQSRQYVAADRNATFYMISILTELAARCEDESRKQEIIQKLKDLNQAAQAHLTTKPDREELKSRCSKALEIIEDPDRYQTELDQRGWVGGRA